MNFFKSFRQILKFDNVGRQLKKLWKVSLHSNFFAICKMYWFGFWPLDWKAKFGSILVLSLTIFSNLLMRVVQFYKKSHLPLKLPLVPIFTHLNIYLQRTGKHS